MPYIGNTTSDFSIDTGNITNRAVTALKLSPSSVGSNGQVLSVDGSGNLQWSTDSALTLIDEDNMSSNSASSVPSQQSVKAYADTKAVLTGSTNNTIATVTGANALVGEANLTFDGHQLYVTTGNASDPLLVNATYGNRKLLVRETGDGNSNTGITIQKKHSTLHPNGYWYGDIRFEGWDGDQYRRAALIECVAEGTPANDNMPGQLRIHTNPGQASQEERIRITKDGDVGIGTSSPGTKLDVSGDIRVKSSGVYKAGHNGSESAPLYTVNDADTGIFRGANANELAFATAANSRMLIDADGKVGVGTTSPTTRFTIVQSADDSTGGLAIFDSSASSSFRIFRNGAGAGSVVSFQDRGSDVINIKDQLVGIGTTSPSCKLNIVGATGTDPTVQINHSNADVQGEFLRVARTDLPTIRYHSLVAQHGGAAANNFIGFKIHTGSTTTSQSDVLRIRGNGCVGINTNDPSAALYIDTSHYVVTDSGQSTTGIHLDGTTGNAGEYGGGISFGCGASGAAAIAARQCTSDGDVVGLSFFTHDSGTGSADAVEKVRIMDGGVTCFNNGIGLGNSLTVAASNTLDDYEEGTWTPAITPTSGSVTSYYNQEGAYTKIGRLVKCHYRLRVNNAGDASGNIMISGLPFTVGNTLFSTGLDGSGRPTYWTGQATNIVEMTMTPVGGETKAYIYCATGAATTLTNLTDSNAFGNGWDVRAELMYFV